MSIVRDGIELFKGRVLGFTSRTERIMSDVYADIRYAVVLNDKNEIENYAVSNSEFGASAGVTAWTVDATDEVLGLAFVAVASKEIKRLEAERAAAVDAMVHQAKEPRLYADVKVVAGRKIAHGTVGRVFWMGTTKYGPSLGMELADGQRVFTAPRNVTIVNPDEFIDTEFCAAKPDFTEAANKVAAEAVNGWVKEREDARLRAERVAEAARIQAAAAAAVAASTAYGVKIINVG